MSNTNLTPQQKIRQVRAHLANPIEVQYLSWLTEGSWIDLAEQAGAIVELDGMYYRAENTPLVFSAGESTETIPVNQPELLPTSSPVAHALAHLQATNDHYFYTCGFWEQLPDPTTQDAVEAVFGFSVQPKTSSSEKQVDNFLATRSTIERISEELRQEIAAMGEQILQEVQVGLEEIAEGKNFFPELPGLSLKNGDRVWKDGYLLYTGLRNDCVLSANWIPGAIVKRNGHTGNSWKLIVTVPQLEEFLAGQEKLATYKAKNKAA